MVSAPAFFCQRLYQLSSLYCGQAVAELALPSHRQVPLRRGLNVFTHSHAPAASDAGGQRRAGESDCDLGLRLPERPNGAPRGHGHRLDGGQSRQEISVMYCCAYGNLPSLPCMRWSPSPRAWPSFSAL